MSGDASRTQNNQNKNLTDRDRQIADIKTRLNTIKTQRDLDIANATAQHDYALAGAQGDADLFAADKMFGLQASNVQAKQGQQFQQDNMGLQNDYQLGQMAKGHEYDLENYAVQFQNEMQLEAQKFGFQSALQSQAAQQELAAIGARAQSQLSASRVESNSELDAAMRAYYDTNSPEYKVRVAQINEKQMMNEQSIKANAKLEAQTKLALTYDATIKMPTNYSDSFLGGLRNKISGYDSAQKRYLDNLEAKNAYYELGQ
jgi:hypothetical protein